MKKYKFHFTFIKTIKFMNLRGISLKQICSKTNKFIMELHLKLTKKKYIFILKISLRVFCLKKFLIFPSLLLVANGYNLFILKYLLYFFKDLTNQQLFVVKFQSYLDHLEIKNTINMNLFYTRFNLSCQLRIYKTICVAYLNKSY